MSTKSSSGHSILGTIFVIGLLVGLIGLGVFLSRFLELVETLGHNIPQNNLSLDYVTALVWAIALGTSILFWPVPFKDKKSLLLIWLVRVLVALGFMLLYEAHYPGLDSYDYFTRATLMNFPWHVEQSLGTHIITVLAWLNQQVIPASYHATKISFSMVGLIALYIFYRAAVIFLQREDNRVFYVLSLFPTILFWSSVLGKEPIILLGIALYTYGVVGMYQFKKKHFLVILLLGVMISMMIRLWMGPILIAPLIIIILYLRSQSVIFKVVGIVLVSTMFFLSMNYFKDYFRFESTDDVLEFSSNLSQSWAIGGSAQVLNTELTTISSISVFLPLGMFTALFRPMPGEFLSNPYAVMASLDNLGLLLLLGLALKRKCWRELRKPLIMWATLLVVLWAVFYAPVSYQNLGTAMRYKLQILPVFLGLLLYLAQPRTKILSIHRDKFEAS